jgi:hypothetical protein
MLVALVVMALLVGLLAQVTTLTSQAISLNARKLDTAGQARVVFDRLSSDLAARPHRSDLGMLLVKAIGNDSFQFYSEVPGYSGARQISAVGYRVQESTFGRLYQLERGAIGTDWGPTAGPNPFVQFLPASLTAVSNSDPNYEVLANGVFRLEYCYLLNTGALKNESTQSDYSDVKALVVAIGVLDSTSRQLVTTSQLQQLSADLPDCVEGQNPISGWNTALNQSGFGAEIPLKAIQDIRVYQRTIYVP